MANVLVEDELSSTYTWILQCLVKATDNIIPKSFWTDSEPGLINAIAQVFLNTPHFYYLKVKYTTVGLSHLSSQFFSDVDTVIVEFLTPLILSLQRFQISQLFTYEEQLISYSFDNSPSDTPNNNFIEDMVDELQVMLKAILNDMDTSYIKYSKFHISIIPIKWYKDDILMKLSSSILENSPVFTAVESSDIAYLIGHFQGSYNNEIIQQIIPKRNKFGVAFSTAKTAINIALETGCDNELVKLLRDFISTKQRSRNVVDLKNNMEVENIEHDEN
ncbi:hypothetical protein RhiirA4_459168 [Rhizophagus irregularis]|uniref:MULE transposase domain-containing protein n=1 Tax=Rhizophagus irregularis TaxID=588596 RepID=A0A2I1GDU1_9GLOM|nr:hypothetical protein RhiirA4_459168 [Rhizophagus irregularis]